VIEFIKQKRPDATEISVTVTINLLKAIELIDKIRKDEEMSDIKILVGGYPFNIDKELWKKVGTDLYVPNALKTSSILSKAF